MRSSRSHIDEPENGGNPDTKARGWMHLPHGADIRLRAWGSTQAAAFEEAAVAMTAAVTDPALVQAKETVSVSCSAAEPDQLLVEWLNALVFEMATRRMLFSQFEVIIDDNRLNAVARGESVDRERHRPATEVKGATYTALSVVQNPDGTWVAECVVDV